MAENRIDLRPVAPAHRGAWSALWRDYLAVGRVALPEATFDASFARLLSSDASTPQGLLAWEGGTAVGLVHWTERPHPWRPRGLRTLRDLFVAPAARGRGIARTLIEAVYAEGAAPLPGPASLRPAHRRGRSSAFLRAGRS